MPTTTQYYLPPEWAPQSGVMITWPHQLTDWAPLLARVEPVYVSIVQAITQYELALIICANETHRTHVQALLKNAKVPLEQCRLVTLLSNDTWTRDYGPITVYDAEQTPVLLDFTFNAWGNKYQAENDNAINQSLYAQKAFKQPPLKIPLILEGGSIETNGAGTLLTTTRCLMAKTRNPDLTQTEITEQLRMLFGIEQIIWLNEGALDGDDTDSHIDTLARFVDPQTIVYVRCDDPLDPHYETLQAMEAELQKAQDLKGHPFHLVPVPLPKKKLNAQGQRLPATYANFLIINGAVLLPTYEDDMDTLAHQQLQNCFPDRTVIDIPCSPIIEQYGSLHCITMQLPKGVL